MTWSAILLALSLLLPNAQFFAQTRFSVSDSDGVPFLSELERRGGPEALGYPVSRRFIWKGTLVQAFQKAVLQWLPNEHRIAYLNVFDDMSSAGLDGWLRVVRSTPDHAWLPNEDKLTWDEVVKGRLAFLDADPAIKARYFSVDDPMTLYGLPSSRIEDMGNHYAIRLQRAVIQRWKVDVPWARAGETTVANGGDIAKEAGMFPAEALIAEGTVQATPVPAAPTPAPSTARKVVVLDPGHGGGQVGAAGGGLYEKEVNLDVVRRAAALLRAQGFEVKQTRDGDYQAGGPTLAEDLQTRIDIANDAHADVFVSLHNNGSPDRSLRGTEVYYAADRSFSDKNRALAQLLYDGVRREIAATGYDPFPRGVKTDTGYDGLHLFLLSPQTDRVKRPAQMPGALVEGLFLTNADDAAQLGRPEVREAYARGVSQAIASFLARG